MPERFGVPVRSERNALLLEATILIKECLYTDAHPRQILQIDQLNGMPKCIIKRTIHVRWKFENWASGFVQMTHHGVKYT
jgi:hypothetical protein